jgi:hypothetical protein
VPTHGAKIASLKHKKKHFNQNRHSAEEIRLSKKFERKRIKNKAKSTKK